MRAMAISPENTLVPEERPEPTPRDGEVLVDVIAAGVNRADLAQVDGSYPPPPGASDLPGLEVSGRRRDTGEQVVALLPGGGYAETVAVHPDLLLPIPWGMDPVDAAGVVEVCATVVSNLVIEARLREGETVLIHGASGGIGTAAVQIAHALGARVLASVGSEEAAEQVRALGADRAWNRHETDLVEAVRADGGADVILDVLGGPAISPRRSRSWTAPASSSGLCWPTAACASRSRSALTSHRPLRRIRCSPVVVTWGRSCCASSGDRPRRQQMARCWA